ncbi:UNVERIFIED_ORG: hypothetical protein ABIB52_000797 [Arthrobacter sp. UYCu721]
MTRYSEPTNRQIERARAMIFLAETKKALRCEHLSGLKLELEVQTNIHNQSVYRVHATVKGIRITGPEGRDVHPVTGTPFTVARLVLIDAQKDIKQQQAASAAEATAASHKSAA